MCPSIPLTIILEFADGLKAATSFDALPSHLRDEILRQPFACRPAADLKKENFLLLEWDDGWKEVIELDTPCTEINRYYVISRPEEVGRLSLNGQNTYPELIEIARKPFNLNRITFLDTFELQDTSSNREGNKTEHFFALAAADASLPEALKSLQQALAEEEVDLREMQSGDTARLKSQYERVRKRMGLRATRRQQDVYDFITYLAKAAT